jgi:hypothetical protein
MKNITLKNEDTDLVINLDVYEDWSEINLEKYFNIIDIISKKDQLDDLSFFIEMIKIISKNEISKDILDIPISEFDKLTSIVNNFNLTNIKDTLPDVVTIDGVNYVIKKNLSNLTISEMVWIKNYEKDFKNTTDKLLSKLVILLRPGYQKDDKWIQKPYDNDLFEERKKLFLKKLSPVEAIPIINFFLTGK